MPTWLESILPLAIQNDQFMPKGGTDRLVVLVILIIFQELGIALQNSIQGKASDALALV